MTTIKKSPWKYILTLALLIVVVLALFYFVIQKAGQFTGPTRAEAVGDNGIYVSDSYGFGLMFPKYWSGSKVEEKNGGVEFSLKDKNGKYVPAFAVKKLSDSEYSKTISDSSGKTPSFIAYKDGNNFAYLMLIGDDKRSEFAEPFSSSNYGGFGYDVGSNIIPTFKFVEKDASDLRSNFQKSNEFRLMDIKAGDKVGGMTVASVAPFDKSDGETPAVINAGNVEAKFSGETTLTGTYESFEVDPATMSGGLVCFRDLDEASEKKIPRLFWGEGTARFCFSNQDMAKDSFQPLGSTGTATVVVDDYTINRIPAQVTDTARLVKVVEKKQS